MSGLHPELQEVVGSRAEEVVILCSLPAERCPRRAYCLEETAMWMGATVAIFVALFTAIFLPLVMSGKQWRAAQDAARVRRMAEHRMNARLLRLNL